MEMESESDFFKQLENDVFEHLKPGELPTEPNPGEDPIDFAQRLQYLIGVYPDEDQYLVGKEALEIIKSSYSYEIIGRGLSVHALRGFIFSSNKDNHTQGIMKTPFHVKGFCAPFRFAILPSESTLSLQVEMPTLLADDSRPIASIETDIPLSIPVLGIDSHKFV